VQEDIHVTNLSIRIHAALTNFIASLREERGQDLLEYAMLGGLIAAAIVAVLVLFSGSISTMITNIGKCIDFDNTTACTPGF
jgi:Flp pilus assembly pilin Flp